MDYSGGGGRRETERWLEIATKLLEARDLVGSKRFAERALESDPLLVGADEVLAVADVLLASQRRPAPSLPHDWYAVLSLSAGPSSSLADIKLAYRRLSSLLTPTRNHHTGAQDALRLVEDAYAILSDPTKKALYDSELQRYVQEPQPQTPPLEASAGSAAHPFWTVCGRCCYVHQYEGKYVGKRVRCTNCETVFVAAALEKEPSIVSGTDMYHCAWGFFPIGFPSAAEVNSGWKPFLPMFPYGNAAGVAKKDEKADAGTGMGQANGIGARGAGGESASGVSAGAGSVSKTASGAGLTKTTARKKVGSGFRRGFGGGGGGNSNSVEGREKEAEPIVVEPEPWMTGGGSMGAGGGVDMGMNVGVAEGEAFRGININEEVKGPPVNSETEDMLGYHIDVEGTDELLGNLQNLPFLREDMMHGRMM